MDEILSALSCIPVRECSYAEWLGIGMALKDAGYECTVWDEWSKNDKRYIEGDCERRWASFKGSEHPITVRTIRAMARKNGWISAFTDFEDVQELTPCEMLIHYLETMFQPEDIVGFATQVTQDSHGKLKPINTNLAMNASEFIDRLRSTNDIETVIGPYRADCGAWIRMNPLDGKGQSDKNVSAYRYVLIESDTLPKEEQERFYRKYELPIAALVDSAGKSVHAVVRIDAPDEHEYRHRVNYLFRFLELRSFPVDNANKNPSRLSRMPGVLRDGVMQELLAVNIGKHTWSEWLEYAEELALLPEPIRLCDVETPPPKPPELIRGILRRGHKMLIAGPSKAGKSFLLIELAVAIAEGSTWLGFSCVQGNDRAQASIVFDVAKDMVLQSELLMKRIKIVESQKRLVYMPTRSIYQALSSDVASKYGYNVHACIFDELLGQPNRKLFDVMTEGSGAARKQPLNFIITTAGNDRTSICYEQHAKAADILAGRKHDSTFYPVLYSAPDDADWTDPAVWAMANPSIGRTVDFEYYQQRCESAKENPAEEIQFRQFHLCQWTNTAVRWMPMNKWDACCEEYTMESLIGRACYGGLDLSSTSDLTAFVLVFPPTERDPVYRTLSFFWLPEDTIPLRVRRDHVPYDVWQRQNIILTTEGDVVHYGFIEQFIVNLGRMFNIREIAVDRWNASMMVQALQDDGFTMVPFGQGFKDMSNPTKDLMRLVLEQSLRHDGHPILRWCMDNVFVRTDPAGNIKPDKEKSTEKIDGVVALVMALDRAQRNLNGGSVYDDRGLLILDW